VAAVACGIDWAEGHHDLAIVDQDGEVVASERVANDLAGLTRVIHVLAEHECATEPMPVAIETASGLLVAGLRAAGRTVYAINPMAVSRYRDRYRSSRAKSDAFDAMVLANILRTDRETHRALPCDSEEILALRVLTRAQQDAVWERTEVVNRIRSLLKSFFPNALAAFERGGKHQLYSRSARQLLNHAPTPGLAARLSKASIAAQLRRAGRIRGVDAEAALLQHILRRRAMRQPTQVEQAIGHQLRGLVRQLDAISATLLDLESAIEGAFDAHPDAAIVASFPGLGTQLGARILAEIGDDRNRFADARALRAFAGAAPVTRASGRSRHVHARRAKNDRIAAAGYVWAMAAVRHDPDWERKYRTRRACGDRHVTALRKLFNCMLSKLHHCLTHRQPYRAELAFTHQPVAAA
jgi:transposase